MITHFVLTLALSCVDARVPAGLRSAPMVEQQTSIASSHAARHAADLAIRQVSQTPLDKKTVYGVLVMLRDPKTGLFWWTLTPQYDPVTLDRARNEAKAIFFAENRNQLVGFRLLGYNLVAQSSDMHAASMAAGEKRICSGVKTQLMSWPPATTLASPTYAEFDVVERLGWRFVSRTNDARPGLPATISRIEWEKGRWVVDVRNTVGDVGRFEISPELKLLYAVFQPAPEPKEQ